MTKNIPSYTIEQINSCADLETMNIDIRPLEVHVLNPNNLKFPHRHNFYNLIYISEGSGKVLDTFSIALHQLKRNVGEIPHCPNHRTMDERRYFLRL